MSCGTIINSSTQDDEEENGKNKQTEERLTTKTINSSTLSYCIPFVKKCARKRRARYSSSSLVYGTARVVI